MPRVFVHIGLHKTGTTTVQNSLILSRELLLEAGYNYPLQFGPEISIYGHHLIAFASISRPNYLPPLARERDLEKVWSQLEIILRESENTIISSEEFSVLNREEIEKFGNRLKGFEIIPVIFLRRHAEFLESAYRTTVIHSAYKKEISDFVSVQRTRLDYNHLVRDWISISNGEIKIVNYDDKNTQDDSFAAFCKAIGIDVPSVPQRRLNLSYSAAICEIVRFMRLKGCSELQLATWAKNVAAAVSSPKNQWCLSTEQISEADIRYNDEVQALSDDATLSAFIQTPLEPVRDREQIVHIKNPVAAMLALGSALSPNT